MKEKERLEQLLKHTLSKMKRVIMQLDRLHLEMMIRPSRLLVEERLKHPA